MGSNLLIVAPASYVPETAIAFADPDGRSIVVSAATPLPVAAVDASATSSPLTGAATSAASIGPFIAQPGRPISLRLSGDWSGMVQVTDSIDRGVTRLPLTAGGRGWGRFTANANEEAVRTPARADQWFFLDVTITSGTLAYWMGQ